ncbi:MAG: zinc ribbon domain-containing protein [Solobacterium sp.]|nr:zinc ribbon domain-containing protein [Solobacterium sp.]
MKANDKRIRGRYMKRNMMIWLFLVFLSICGLAIAAFFLPITEMIGAITIVVFLLFVALIVLSVIALIKSNRLKSRIKRQGSLESFNATPFEEVGNSKTLFVNKDWLVWKQGYHYELFAKDRIRGIQARPNQREGNKIAILDVYTTDYNEPQPVTYEVKPNVNIPQMLWNWAGSSTVSSTSEPTPTAMARPALQDGKVTCPCCMAPNDASLEYCTYCGSKLARVPNQAQ